MDWLQHLPWGAFATIFFSFVVSALTIWTAYVKFRTKTELGLGSVTDSLKDTNERVTKLAEGVSSQRTDLTEFKDHVRSHYVENGDLVEVKQGFQSSMNDLRDDVREATGTMSDVRDVVQRMEVKLFPDKPSEIPPKRRRAPAKSGV